jgi:hypothetical protein
LVPCYSYRYIVAHYLSRLVGKIRQLLPSTLCTPVCCAQQIPPAKSRGGIGEYCCLSLVQEECCIREAEPVTRETVLKPVFVLLDSLPSRPEAYTLKLGLHIAFLATGGEGPGRRIRQRPTRLARPRIDAPSESDHRRGKFGSRKGRIRAASLLGGGILSGDHVRPTTLRGLNLGGWATRQVGREGRER